MRSLPVRVLAVVLATAVVWSCDSGPVTPKFGNGIGGGASGTSPITPDDPSVPDTEPPFIIIQTPGTDPQTVNVGDSLLVAVRVLDGRQVASLSIQGVQKTGDADLGTLKETVRFPQITVPASGALRTGLMDTTFTRYLKPGTPVDSTAGDVILRVIATDGAGNVKTDSTTLSLRRGPSVTLLGLPDSVPRGIAVPISINAQVKSTAGVRRMKIRTRGESTWPTPLDDQFDTTFTGVQTDVTFSHIVTVPANAPLDGKIVVTDTAFDINGNPGSTPEFTITVKEYTNSVPHVTQVVSDRLEIDDRIIVDATGPLGITRVGFIVMDLELKTVIKTGFVDRTDVTVNAHDTLDLNLSAAEQGLSFRILSFAVDQAGTTGYSVASDFAGSQDIQSQAHTDSVLIVFGRTYPLPRAGVIGDMVVDAARGHVLLSNMNTNRLEVWDNATREFDDVGVAVGSQPWGLALGIDPDELLVANSGGTNISRVNLGTGPISTIQEDLDRRIRTRTNFLYVLTEGHDAGGAARIGVSPPRMFSDRPQYIGQIADGTIFFSTRPTPTAPDGTVRYLDPTQPFPDLRTFVFVNGLGGSIQNFVIVDADSAISRAAGAPSIPDTIYIFDHLPGTNQPSAVVKAPTCRSSLLPAIAGRESCDAPDATDPRFDPRFPAGLEQGTLSAALAMRTYDATCSPNCSDLTVIENVNPVGITDTTFVATSADRNWIAFGEGNSSPGLLMMANVDPTLNSPIITQIDLTNQASERILGLAIDRTGQTIAAHGVQSYFSAVEEPFHLRLQGIYGDAGTGGAGIAYHPDANGNSSSALPPDERLAFVAAGDKSIHAVDIAFFIRRGRYDLKHQLYGPLRVSRALAGDDPSIVLKLYGISLDGGLTVIDLRAVDILPVP